MAVLDEIKEAVINGNKAAAASGVQQALDEGLTPGVILNDALIPAMTEVGLRFENGEYFVPEMLIAARAMQAGLDLLKPLLVQSGIQPIATVAIGTVKGDLHDIGKNLVAIMLEGAGFAIRDLGVNAAPEKFVQAAAEGAQIVAMSALLTTTMPSMKVTVEALKAAGLRERVKVMIGGAPVTQAYADEIGADGYSPDASSATRLAKSLLGAV
ncbi:MAG: cobalamin-binding protein [Chloroflexi bacterium]|nr:cobalamin-binding protein [Chloroflexota bacterium]MDL1884448.1 cobalamin-binding protein [Anaerolineae bacterium CFX8]